MGKADVGVVKRGAALNDEEILAIEEQLEQPIKLRQDDTRFAEQARKWLRSLIDDVRHLRNENRELHTSARMLDAWLKEIAALVVPGRHWVSPPEIKDAVYALTLELARERSEGEREALRERAQRLQITAADIAALKALLDMIVVEPPSTAIVARNQPEEDS